MDADLRRHDGVNGSPRHQPIRLFRLRPLEGTPAVPIDVGLQAWLLDRFRQQVHAPPKDFCKSGVPAR